MSQGRFVFGGTVNAEALADPKQVPQTALKSVFRAIKNRVDQLLPIPQSAAFVQAYLKANSEESVTAILDDVVDERHLALNKKAEVRKTRRNQETYEAEAAAAADHCEAIEVRDAWLSYLELLHAFFGKESTFREIVDGKELF